MERFSTLLIAVLSVLCLWMAAHSVEGKCRGDWKSYHGCIGGNGKRSDPSIEQVPQESAFRNMLNKILKNQMTSYEENELSRPVEVRADRDERPVETLLRKALERLSAKYSRK